MCLGTHMRVCMGDHVCSKVTAGSIQWCRTVMLMIAASAPGDVHMPHPRHGVECGWHWVLVARRTMSVIQKKRQWVDWRLVA